MTQAEKETIDVFCRELALALRRITGHKINLSPEELPTEVESDSMAEFQPQSTSSCQT